MSSSLQSSDVGIGSNVQMKLPDHESETSRGCNMCCSCRWLVSGLLLLSLVVVGGVFGGWPEDYHSPHLEPSLRAIRAGLLLSLWVFGHAINTLGWRKAGLHNVVIFESVPPLFLNFEKMFLVWHPQLATNCLGY